MQVAASISRSSRSRRAFSARVVSFRRREGSESKTLEAWRLITQTALARPDGSTDFTMWAWLMPIVLRLRRVRACLATRPPIVAHTLTVAGSAATNKQDCGR